MAQTETVINLVQATVQERSVEMDHDAGQTTHVEGGHLVNTQMDTGIVTHNINSGEVREAETFGEANPSSPNSQTTAPEIVEAMPQKISPPIQILRRSLEKNIEAAVAQNERTAEGGQDQPGIQRSRAEARGQRGNKDKLAAVKGKAPVLPVVAQAGDKARNLANCLSVFSFLILPGKGAYL